LITLVVGLALGYLAYVDESPGDTPAAAGALVALLVALVIAGGWWLLQRRNRGLVRTFVVSMVVVGVLVVWWAWAFAMPLAMAWDSGATADALGALRGISPDQSVCVTVTSGSIGPLTAPYERCALDGPPGAEVTYFAGGSDNGLARGLIFFDGPLRGGADQFVRHLVGGWYAFTQDSSGALGYTFTGGP
jgi:hypothetical protein